MYFYKVTHPDGSLACKMTGYPGNHKHEIDIQCNKLLLFYLIFTFFFTILSSNFLVIQNLDLNMKCLLISSAIFLVIY